MEATGGCDFTGNSAGTGGAVSIDGGKATFSGCTFSGNTAAFYGGGMTVSGGIVTIESSMLTANSSEDRGGGIAVRSEGSVTIHESTISDNSASAYFYFGDGGGVYSSGTFVATDDCHFTGNQADNTANDAGTGTSGGTVFINGGQATFTGCTISGNSARTMGGGIAIMRWYGDDRVIVTLSQQRLWDCFQRGRRRHQ